MTSTEDQDPHMLAAELSAIRHDLKTPLNAILGYTEMLLEDLGDGDAAADLHKIHEAARHLLRLIGERLDPAAFGQHQPPAGGATDPAATVTPPIDVSAEVAAVGAPAERHDVTPETLAQLFAQLEILIRDCDADAFDVARTLAATNWIAALGPQTEALLARLSAYDFDAALEALTTLRDAAGMSSDG